MSLTPGNTPLLRLTGIWETFGVSPFLIKDESANPTGTWKDRRSAMIVKRAAAQHMQRLCLITAGNAGISLVNFTKNTDIAITVIVDTQTPVRIEHALRSSGAEVIRTSLTNRVLSSADLIALSRKHGREKIWDVTNGFEDAYGTIIQEFRGTPCDVLVCPVGSGEAFVGMANEIEKLHLSIKLLGVIPQTLPSLADKLHTSWTPYASRLIELEKSGHHIVPVSEQDIESAYSKVKDFIRCEPSSAIVFAALQTRKLPIEARVIVINSGRGISTT